MSRLTYPKFQSPALDGANLSGGKVYFYESGTTTPKDTYSDSDLSTPNTNPVILNARGEADIYLNGEYKIVLKDSTDTTIWTEDNYSVLSNSQWGTSVPATYVSATSFKVIGDLTADYETGRRIKCTDASTLYGAITLSSYFAPDTTVNISLDSGSLSVSLTGVELSILTVSNDALPINSRTIYKGVATGTADALTVALTPTLTSDTLSDGDLLFVRALLANATTTPTLDPDGIGALTIVKEGSQVLVAGDIARADHELIFKYNLTNTEWELLNPVTVSQEQINTSSIIPIVQIVRTDDGAVATGTTVMIHDDTIPQSSEGDQYMNVSITPTSTTNKLIIEAVGWVSHSATDTIVGGLFQDSITSALVAGKSWASAPVVMRPLYLQHEMVAGTTSSTTFKFICGGIAAGTTTFNGQSGSRILGGVINSYIKVTEVMQ